MKRVQSIIFLSFMSMGCLANTGLLNEYNKEIDPYYKKLKNTSVILHQLAEKELRGVTITSQEHKKVFFLNCGSLGYLNKIKAISHKPKYRSLEKAKRLSSMASKTKEVMDVTEKECNQQGIFVPLD